ncbi:Diaminopimelate decarboxylase [Beauveria bassiana D1-5]|uniref:Diaminopimelate decarboxylase n=1 Tax=Beauveria bassiana D1-5 TaxID=1245745 RepID=A0A0A2WKE4_BEABA|nr:Diaminopimelate decarboxylase [Beauveria bassiana D1-5]
MPRSLHDTTTALNAQNLLTLPAEFGCPVWVYDAEIIRQQIAQLRQFDVIRFAQKACSNIHILKLMREQGVKVDSVSQGEIERALAAGYTPLENPDDIVFTADVIDTATLALVAEQKIPVNIGSVDMLHQLGEISPGHRVWLRINPGFGHGHSQKTNTGGENSKHGIWLSDMPKALEAMQRYGIHLIGIHMHIGSGVDYGHLEQVCGAMVQQVIDFGQDLEAISAGGGLSIPYREGEETIDTDHYYGLWNAAREKIAAHLGHPVKLEIEPGRFLVAEAGVLVSQVRAVKDMGSRHFVLIDAGFNDLMRPSMYGSYHHISALAGDGRDLAALPARETVVAGPLCESGDVFTQQEGGKPPAAAGSAV